MQPRIELTFAYGRKPRSDILGRTNHPAHQEIHDPEEAADGKKHQKRLNAPLNHQSLVAVDGNLLVDGVDLRDEAFQLIGADRIGLFAGEQEKRPHHIAPFVQKRINGLLFFATVNKKLVAEIAFADAAHRLINGSVLRGEILSPKRTIRKKIQTIDAGRKASHLVLIGACRLHLLTQIHLVADGADDKGHPQGRERNQTRREPVVETNHAFDVEVHIASGVIRFSPTPAVRPQWRSDRAARSDTAPPCPYGRGAR